ncbi:2-hydroxyacid dehydrogenase [Pseudooceanicola sp. LIPI14-2-Ac024]|uniref:2-hydroxyacid dehydrogenase n=1 Tax=Pseudooceanicola sp. LIPI14-2-Ac024 TaxID=3344875 RepID=UPI0035CEB549
MSAAGPEVLVVAPIRPAQMEALGAAYTLHRLDLADAPEALLAEVGPRVAALVTTGSAGVPAGLLPSLPGLRLIATSSVGTDRIDLAACAERGIVVTNTPDVLTDDVADLALGLILATHRRMVAGDAWVRSGDWGREGPFPLTATLTGRRVGILGLGAIGMAVAERCQAFRMEIGYCSRAPKTVDFAYHAAPIALAGWADILVACLPGGAATRHVIDAGVLAALGPAGALINVARGSVVDETALIEALETGTIATAGLDVFASEPAPDPRLTALPNVTLYPHHASGTVATRDRMAELVVENLAAFFGTGAALTPVALPVSPA